MNDNDIVGNYRLIEELGRGGFGIVYKAEDLGLHREVALKMQHLQQNTEQLSRFKREMEVLACLNHPNIVTIYVSGEHEGKPYFVMEYVGTSLDKKLKDGPLAPRVAARMVRDLAEAVQFAHDREIIHRDLKPANILLGENGTVKVADFGLARFLQNSERLTKTGAVMGTQAYMSPEQLSGKAADTRTDIWGLGAILYECLTGKLPFAGLTLWEVFRKIQNGKEEVTPPRKWNPEVPAVLQDICLECLKIKRWERFRSAQDLAENLSLRFLNNGQVVTPPLKILQERIAVRVYEKWVNRGRPLGTRMQDWIEAENELKAEMMRKR